MNGGNNFALGYTQRATILSTSNKMSFGLNHESGAESITPHWPAAQYTTTVLWMPSNNNHNKLLMLLLLLLLQWCYVVNLFVMHHEGQQYFFLSNIFLEYPAQPHSQ